MKLAIIPFLFMLSCASLPQSAAPTASGEDNKVSVVQKQSVVDMAKETTAKPDISGSQNKTTTVVNDPMLLYGVILLVGVIAAGLFLQMRQQTKYQMKRLEIYESRGHMVPESKR